MRAAVRKNSAGYRSMHASGVDSPTRLSAVNQTTSETVRGRCNVGHTIRINRGGGVSIHGCGVIIGHLRVTDECGNKPVSCRMSICCMKVLVTKQFKHCEDHSPAGTKELEVLKPKSMASPLVCF